MTQASIFSEQSTVIAHTALATDQYLLRLHAPKCAGSVQPGNFIHLSCDQNRRRLKRPFSVLRSAGSQGWIEVLYKIVGEGTEILSRRQPGERLNCLGPIGNSFSLSASCKYPLLLGGGVGIPPILFFAEKLKKTRHITPLVIMGSEITFPFKIQPSKIMVEGLPEDAIASMALLEDLNIPSRLTSKQNYAGCYYGYAHQLAALWLKRLKAHQRAGVEIFACGPAPMLKASAELSRAFDLPCQLSLEEYMACAVGGCAGCTVKVVDPSGHIQMQRVCVDGPVFSAHAVYPLLSSQAASGSSD